MAIQVLMAEDNPDDVELMREALVESKLDISVHAVHDGVEALAFLRRESPYDDAPQPDLLLLDLNMPRKDGREVLKEVREDESLRGLPIVVLTTSQAEEDIAEAYKLCVNCYVSKPVDFDQFMKVVSAIEEFWFTIVKLPSRK